MIVDRGWRGFVLVLCGILACSVALLAEGRTAGAQPSPPTINCPGGSLKGCFTSSDQMARYLDMVTPLVTDFFVTRYGASFPRPKIRYVKAQESGPTGCEDDNGKLAGFDKDAYFYCPP